MTPDEAREFTEALTQIVTGAWRQAALGIRLGVPDALDMDRRTWAGQVGAAVRDREERRQAVAELTEEGMSTREIADTLGVDPATVSRDQHAADPEPVANATAEPEPEPEAEVMVVADPEPVANATPEPIPNGREPQPTPEELEAEQRERDRLDAIRRHQTRLRELVNGWVEIPGLAGNPDRDVILAGLADPDRDRVLEIESIYLSAKASDLWPKTSMAASTNS